MQGLEATDDYPEGPRWWLALLACVLVIMGAKLTLILFYGSPVPFWDQWDAEGGQIYQPYLQGYVPLGNLIAAHNEHRILIPRLLALGELEFAGRWDPILQMCINAMLHTGFVVTLMVLLRRMVSATAAVALTAFVALLVSVPFAWENVLAGFQSQFYLVLLFSIISLTLLAVAPAFDVRWGVGILFAVLGYFSLSAGGGTLVIAGVIAAAQVAIGRRAGRREWAGIAVLLASGLVLLALVPQPPYHAALKAQSIGQFFLALQSVASWPLKSMPFAPFLLNAPLVWLAVCVLRERRPLSDPAWLCIGIGGWIGMQEILLAYGRAPDVRASRYLDLMVVLVSVNFVATAALLKGLVPTGTRRTAGLALAAAWLLIVTMGIGYSAMKNVAADVINRGQTGKMQVENVRNYLATGDMAHLKGKPFLQVPYPNADRLASLLNLPEIRGILSPELLDDPAARAAMQARLSSGGMFAPLAWKIRTWLPLAGPYIGFAGIAFYFLAGLAGRLRARRALPAPDAVSHAEERPPAAAPNLA
ncbi:hypothetical protein [Roseixanthobacter glucoisosaccharinicivorans]|uniref:hypothetical protein n=1 Tax=Roseixanthobacter glucoisosaccharinicivorans TaxID=3119923 RepID=UPI003727F446